MATIFKPKYTKSIPPHAEIITKDDKPHARFKNHHGKTITCPLTEAGDKILVENRKWYIEYRKANGELVRVPGFKDRKATEQLAAELERTAARQVVGLIDPTMEEAKRPLKDHLEEYEAKMKAGNRKSKHIKTTLLYIRSIVDHANWQTPADIQARPVVQYVGHLQDKGRSARTVQAYLTAIKGFSRWLTNENRLPRDPLNSISKPDPKAARKHERRMLLPEEWSWLQSATLAGPEILGMPAVERALLYAVAIQTGLRSTELRSLKRGQLYLEVENPFITCKARSTKNSKPARQYITPDLAKELKIHVARKSPQAPVFTMPEPSDVAKMLRQDLAAARKTWLNSFQDDPEIYQQHQQSDFLSPVNHDGEVLDFHSLRHTCGSWLALAGAHPNAVKAVMRHSTITLTMDTYGHLFPGQEADTVARFPHMMGKEVVEATGTDGKHVDKHAGTSHMPPHQSAPICIPYVDSEEEGKFTEVVGNSPLSIDLHREASKEEIAPSRTRTLNPLIKSQEECLHKDMNDKGLQRCNLPACSSACSNSFEDQDLARIIEAWPDLPAPIRRAMLALIGDDKKE